MLDPCTVCIQVAEHPHFNTPDHVVHPEHGKAMVYDKHGLAVCRHCGAGWYRGRDNKSMLLRG